MKYLFEVSWEVCNKVGGIHTVIASKAATAIAHFGDGYWLLGPLTESNSEFVETDEPAFAAVRAALEAKGIRFKMGRFDIPARPKVILVDFKNRFDVDKLMFDYWQRFGVDSIAGHWDYVEPVLFSTACGEAIEAICDAVVTDADNAVAQFHEWMCGGGLLHLKQGAPAIGTVFTTHATILGRSLAGAGRDIYAPDAAIRPVEDASALGVSAKHSMEVACAREADCFTTVSGVTADEAEIILGKRPDRVVFNGFDVAGFGAPEEVRERGRATRRRLVAIAERLVLRDLEPGTRLFLSSGRYEYRNKGYDVFVRALAALDQRLRDEKAAPVVLAWITAASDNAGVSDEMRRRVQEGSRAFGAPEICTHRLWDEGNDPIVRACRELGLVNGPDNKVLVLLTSAYLNGRDGLLDLPYYDVLAASDLGVFPSWYEPWGYTPLEAIALGVPTVTTDLAGFGRWARSVPSDRGRGVTIVDRGGRSEEAVVRDLADILDAFAHVGETELDEVRAKARAVAEEASWGRFFGGYVEAYNLAASRAARRVDSLDTSLFSEELFSTFRPSEYRGPHYRSFTVVPTLPEAIAGLREIAHNLWWSWHPEGQELFEDIDPDLWETCRHNPVRVLARVLPARLEEKAKDPQFLRRYERVSRAFSGYLAEEPSQSSPCGDLGARSPVAYLSMEFCLHECLPIYSGGLGVLSGDHLKAASDVNFPLVAVGLFYRQGYFKQQVDLLGEQLEQYPFLETSELPIRVAVDEAGRELRVHVDLAGRIVAARAWEIRVGRVKLYALDTDVEENRPRDREITWRLYGGDRQTRIEQEILLGVGGVQLLEEVLGLAPSVYHLNEGHSGFALFERIRRLMGRGLAFQEAREAVKAASVFTTHTPVPAGNETFDLDLVRRYFEPLTQELGIKWSQLEEMGIAEAGDGPRKFSMTVLGLKLSSKANAVSKLHGEVCRQMWNSVWKDVAVEEVPIGAITNGIHLTSWIGRDMHRLFGQYLDLRWDENHDDPIVWERVDEIPDDRLWYEHMAQKRRLIESVKERCVRDFSRRGEDPQLLRDTLERLDPEALTIGFARRFATYKRATLLFRDLERLARILGDPRRPVQLLIAGKAHPADRGGKDLIRQIVELSRSEELRGRIVFIENYNMELGRLMTQGVDVWLNTPIRPHEASGTSGMKVLANGGLNCSILDGWWDEAYAEGLGWAIDPGVQYKSSEHQDEIDSIALLDLVEREIAPLYYERSDAGVPQLWVDMVKAALRKLCPEFTTMRMVKEYCQRMYRPAAARNASLSADDFAGIRTLTAWKRRINGRFSTVRIEHAALRGVEGEMLPSSAGLEIELEVNRGRLDPHELKAQLVIGPGDDEQFSGATEVLPFDVEIPPAGGDVLRFRLSHRVERPGSFRYAVRLVPVHPLLANDQETGLVLWW
jgi:phosphorylase/glycogen(starch) synthase